MGSSLVHDLRDGSCHLAKGECELFRKRNSASSRCFHCFTNTPVARHSRPVSLCNPFHP